MCPDIRHLTQHMGAKDVPSQSNSKYEVIIGGMRQSAAQLGKGCGKLPRGQNAMPRRAQREADANLVCARCDSIGHHGVWEYPHACG